MTSGGERGSPGPGVPELSVPEPGVPERGVPERGVPEPGAPGRGVSVLIATPLEAEHAARIEAVDPRISVMYEPGLLPVPRYPSDHTGVPRVLSAAGLERWAAVRAEADVSFDFDWHEPAATALNSPRLRWVQATSAGIGGFLERTGLVTTPMVFTTAAGVHGGPLAECAARPALLRQGHADAGPLEG
jgi:glyoxylate/hydroxypyruvate reductase